MDKRRDKAEGEAMDLSHAVPLARPVQVHSGDYPNLEGAAVVCVAALREVVAGRSLRLRLRLVPWVHARRRRSKAFWACIRFSACWKITALSLSTISRLIS